MNIIPFKFDDLILRTFADERGEPWFVADDVCEAIAHSDTSTAVRRLDDDEKGTNIVCTPSGDQKMLVINESGLYSLILTSRKPEAKRFKKWVTSDVLPSIRKTGSYTAASQPQPAAIEQDLRVVGILADMLNVAPSGRIAMAGVVLKQSAPHLLPVLPGYAVDAPPSAIVSGSSLPTASATDLLKRNGIGMTAAKFNVMLFESDLLEQQQRPSRSGPKVFWSVTEAGEEFGKNVVSAQNTRETQPHWCIDRFPELLTRVGVQQQGVLQ